MCHVWCKEQTERGNTHCGSVAVGGHACCVLALTQLRTLMSLSPPPVARWPSGWKSSVNTGSLLCHTICSVLAFMVDRCCVRCWAVAAVAAAPLAAVLLPAWNVRMRSQGIHTRAGTEGGMSAVEGETPQAHRLVCLQQLCRTDGGCGDGCSRPLYVSCFSGDGHVLRVSPHLSSPTRLGASWWMAAQAPSFQKMCVTPRETHSDLDWVLLP